MLVNSIWLFSITVESLLRTAIISLYNNIKNLFIKDTISSIYSLQITTLQGLPPGSFKSTDLHMYARETAAPLRGTRESCIDCNGLRWSPP